MTDKKKSRLLAAAGLLALLPLFALPFPEAETQVLQPSKAEHRPEKPPMGRLEVKGLEQAEAAQELRDPFTLLHERAAEAPQAAAGSKGKATGTAGPGPLAVKSAAPAVAGKAATEPKTAAGISLQGIAIGAGGRLALLSDGKQTATLAPGERLGDWQVYKVEESRVLLQGPRGEQWLELAMP